VRKAGALDGEGLELATRRQAAIMFVDLKGFTTRASEMNPTEVVRLLRAYQRRIVPCVRSCGGAIDKFMGDGIIVTFGAVEPSATYAADAVRASDAVLADAESWPSSDGPLADLPPHSVRISIATGPVTFGTVGDDDRLEFTVIGPAVNLAAKLEKHNKVLGSLSVTTAECYDLALEQGYQADHPRTVLESTVEGVSTPQALVVLGSPLPSPRTRGVIAARSAGAQLLTAPAVRPPTM
jgi:adenylate cyclase